MEFIDDINSWWDFDSKTCVEREDIVRKRGRKKKKSGFLSENLYIC
jgi:hypothetical protein